MTPLPGPSSFAELHVALAELADATTAFLRDSSGLLELVKARDRADTLLGHTPRGRRAGCDCELAHSGFHTPTCAGTR